MSDCGSGCCSGQEVPAVAGTSRPLESCNSLCIKIRVAGGGVAGTFSSCLGRCHDPDRGTRDRISGLGHGPPRLVTVRLGSCTCSPTVTRRSRRARFSRSPVRLPARTPARCCYKQQNMPVVCAVTQMAGRCCCCRRRGPSESGSGHCGPSWHDSAPISCLEAEASGAQADPAPSQIRLGPHIQA